MQASIWQVQYDTAQVHFAEHGTVRSYLNMFIFITYMLVIVQMHTEESIGNNLSLSSL